jgi:hypothetical protein
MQRDELGEDQERRGGHRRRALKQARVILSDWTVIDCLVRDVSDAGARLEFGGPTELPKEFKVLVVASGRTMEAELGWRRGLSAGVHFTGSADETAPRKV